MRAAAPVVAGWWAAGAGLVAAGAALATGEVLAGVDGHTPSLVLGVADVVVDDTPGGIVRWSIATFGATQKTILVTGIVVVSLSLGAVLGALGRRRWIRAAAGFVAFGAVGGWAGSRSPQVSDARAWLAAGAAAAVGTLVLALALRPGRADRHADRPIEPTAERTTESTAERPPADVGAAQRGPELVVPGRPGPGRERRRFLVITGGAAAYGLAAATVGRWARQARTVEAAREEVAARLGPPTASAGIPRGAVVFDDAVQGISPIITPNTRFYKVDKTLVTPQIDPDGWALRVTGMVDREIEIGFDELLAMDRADEIVTLQCVSNEIGGNLVGNALWSGVRLPELLDRAGIRPGADQIVGRSVDGWTAGFPTALAFDGRSAMVAVAMNGEPLPLAHGFPARLVVGGLYGYVSATKWLTEIELTTWDAFDAYWITRGWAKQGPVKTQSRIDVPRSGATLAAGPTPVAGVAWAPGRSIRRVEVRIDDRSWQRARLSTELSETAWVQWHLEWDAPPGAHRIEVRATDGTGETQTGRITPTAPSGATGHHTITVRVR
jgi:DMSO/TMAO reductase YedYZ molybdopterin-dependent catalytic subunit